MPRRFGPEPGHPYEQRAITATQSKTRRCPPHSDRELMAEKQILGLKPDRRSVQTARLLHHFFKISRHGKVLSLLRVLSVEDDNNLALVAIGGMIDPWICEARRSLHFDMPIEDRTPLAVIPHFVTDNHHSHGILPLLPAGPIQILRLWHLADIERRR